MTTRFQVILFFLTMVMLAGLYRAVKRTALSETFSVFWLLVALMNVLAVLFPAQFFYGFRLMGIYDALNGIFFFGIISLFMLVFYLTVRFSEMREKLQLALVHVTLLQAELAQLKSKLNCEQAGATPHNSPEGMS